MKLGNNERMIRVFNLGGTAEGSGPLTEELAVTNKRIVHTIKKSSTGFAEETGTQIHLKSITGVSYGKEYTRNVGMIVGGVVMLIMSLAMIVLTFVLPGDTLFPLLAPGGVLLIGGLVSLIRGLKKEYSAYIKISAVVGEEAMGFSAGKQFGMGLTLSRPSPTEDFLQMIDELPALLCDITNIAG